MFLNKILRHSIYFSFFALLFLSLNISAAPGDLDQTFGTAGITTTSVAKFSADYGYATAIQPDGKIVVAGRSVDGLRSMFAVTRINTDGSLDTSFGTNGYAVKAFFSSNHALAVAIQSDGKILAGGFARNQTSGFRFNFTIVRFNSDGSIDDSFGNDGFIQYEFENSNSSITDLAIQSDGKIVAAGFTHGTFQSQPLQFAVARFNADGSLDNTFDGDGSLTIFTLDSKVTSVKIQPADGKIILAGWNPSSTSIVRLNTDGSFDTSFGTDGIATSPLTVINSIDLQADGKIVAAGPNYNGVNNDFAVARHNSDGSVDTTFGNNGIVITDITDQQDFANSVKVQPNGKIIVGGYTYLAGANPITPDFLTIGYNSDGSFDNTFGTNGKVFTAATTYDIGNALAIQADGKIILVGFSSDSNFEIAILRYNTDGSLDSSFDSDGISLIELGNGTDVILGITIQPDGKILAVGYSYNGSHRVVAVARYNTDGSLDSSFGSNGVVETPINGVTTFAREAVVLTDGKILVGASSLSRFILIRYNSDGSLDTTFGTDGIVVPEIGSRGQLYDIALQADGKIIAGGIAYFDNTPFAAVARFNSDGTFDTSFDGDGIAVILAGSTSVVGTGVEIQTDGKILLGGFAFYPNTNADFILARFNTDGSLDTTFDDDGTLSTNFDEPGSGDNANTIALQNDGKIILAGFTQNSYALVRYNPDGSLDTSFGGDGKVSADGGNTLLRDVLDIAIEPGGKIVMVGAPGLNVNNPGTSIVRLNSDGSEDNTFNPTSNGIEFNSLFGVELQSDGKIVAGGFTDNGRNYDFAVARYLGGESAGNTRFDLDGDGKTDIGIFRPAPGEWWFLKSSDSNANAFQFGSSSDTITPADFTGDGATDIAFWRESTGDWFVLRSEDSSFFSFPFGQTGDIPAPGDFDGDGIDDPAVFRPSSGTWFYIRSSDGGSPAIQFGQNGDVPIVEDYDGDGTDDLAVFRPSQAEWYLLRSTAGFIGYSFGSPGNVTPVPADYTGDGTADIAFFNENAAAGANNWFVLRSDNESFFAFPFGTSGDIPVPGDYDGDGTADAAVYRPSNQSWFLQQTTDGFEQVQFGIQDDIPIPSAYVP